MAGKTDRTQLQFLFKKALGFANTSNVFTENEETIPSTNQLSTQTIFGQDVPRAVTRTLNTVQSATAEYVLLTASVLAGTTYDANDTGGGGDGAQDPGPHAYSLQMASNYQASTDNSKAGSYPFTDGQTLYGTSGSLQLIGPSFSGNSPNPYLIKLYEDDGSGGIGNEISLTDEIDWMIDYYNGILFVQDYDSSQAPAFAKAFIYTGNMLSASLGGGGGGSGDPNASYVVMSLTGSLSAERVLTAGTGLELTDAGAGGNATLNIFDSIVATISGSTFTGAVNFDSGLSGSLTRLTDGTSYLIAGSNVTIASASSGAVTISSTGGGGGGGGSDVGWIAPSAGQIDTTGSLGVTGSLFIGQSIGHIGETSNKIDFKQGQVLILSGGAATSDDETAAADVSFFVSGTDGGKLAGTGVSVFGGDVQLSGALYLGNSSQYAVAQVVDGLNQLIIDGDNYVDLKADNSIKLYAGPSNIEAMVAYGTDVGSGLGIVVNDDATSTMDFRAETANKTHAIFVDASADQVLILSGGAQVSSDPAAGSDINFFVSGALASKDTAVKGTALFGGDTVISGALTSLSGLSGSLTRLTNGTSYLVAGTNVTITSASNGQVTVAASGGGGGGGGQNVGWLGPSAGQISTTGSLGITGSLHALGSNIFGSSPSSIHILTGSVIASGSLSVSGTLGVSGSVIPAADSLFDLGSASRQWKELYLAGSSLHLGGQTLTAGTDTISYGAGATEKKLIVGNLALSSSIITGDNNADLRLVGPSYFGGTSNVLIQSTRAQVTGVLDVQGGISGSLTRLFDGTSYLQAGNNISVVSKSNGAITISAAGAGSGDITNASNLGAATGFFAQKTGAILDFKSLSVGSGLNISSNTTTVTLTTNFDTLVRQKSVYEVTQSHSEGAPLFLPGVNFSDADYNSNLIDLFVNGQLMTSGTQAQVSADVADYVVVATGSLEFGFLLQSDDSISTTIMNNGASGGGSSSLTLNEAPTGAVNGINDTFTLSSAPSPSTSLLLFVNGQLITQNIDYTLSSVTITFVASVIPMIGDSLLATYQR
jgi:hypothetical protein